MIYANTVKGPKLIGAMYLSGQRCQPGPDIGGPLTQWHAHASLCLDTGGNVLGEPDQNGNCTKGRATKGSQFMLHVWLAPSLGDPLQPEVTRSQYAQIIRTGNL
ncbi:MAG: hypothetical protein HYX32_10765 [Actinobacteria bacterium]|nr:hypothetical protein [Actinomycetota bacterium]